MADIIVILIVLALVLSAVCYIRKAKKKGQCIGCPNASGCIGGCHCQQKTPGDEAKK